MQMPKFRKITTDGHPAYRFELNGKTYEANRFASGAGAWNVDLIDGKKRTTVVSGKDTRTAAVAVIVDTPQAKTAQLDKLTDDVAQMNADADELHADMRVLGSEANKLRTEIAEWGAKVDALTTRTAADFPKGTRVMSPEGRLGTVNGVDIGRVTLPGHSNYGREYVGVNWDAIKGDMGANRRSRPFVDELSLVALLESPRVGERVTYAVGRRTVNATVTRRTNDAGQVGVVDDGDQTGTVRYVSPALLTVQAPELDELHSAALYENRLRNELLAAAAPGEPCKHGFRLRPGAKLSIRCEFGHEYGVFGDEGPIDRADCAVRAANDAARYAAEDDGDTTYEVAIICPEHEEQRAVTCEECYAA
ncbi:hypothetical protein [Streptomyces sp. NPDC102437]|uniref:hypothetical protein n=1 Tax=Streptomyces sp. NPDC102437 TaxID=3366175 RepID=UPI00382DCA20